MKGHTPSQNVRFRWNGDPDDRKLLRPGRGLVLRTGERFTDQGLTVGEPLRWREHGWGLNLSQAPSPNIHLRLLLAGDIRGNTWMTQLYCNSDPGFFRVLFGRPFVDRSTELHAAAILFHAVLLAEGCTEIRWRLNGLPTRRTSSPEPQLPGH